LSQRYFALLPLRGDDHWWSKRFVLNFCALVELSIIILALRRWRCNRQEPAALCGNAIAGKHVAWE
jgi:hypothetical protein